MGNKAARHLGIGFRRQYRLRTFACITSPNAANVERRAAAVTFQCAVTFFAEEFLYPDGGLVFLFVEGDLGYHVPFGLRHFLHVFVEAGDGDAAVDIHYAGQHLAQHVDGVGYRSAEVA